MRVALDYRSANQSHVTTVGEFSAHTCHDFTLFTNLDFTVTLEQATMFLGNQYNFFITTSVESAYYLY
jgi:hypothetical protein